MPSTSFTAYFVIAMFNFIEWPNRPDAKYFYRDAEQYIKVRQAFAQVGPLELELIQPVAGDRNAYREFLEQKGGGIHHVLFEVENMEALLAAIANAGVVVLQPGT